MKNLEISLESANLDTSLLSLLSSNSDTNIQVKICETNKKSLYTGSKSLNEKIRNLAPAPELTNANFEGFGGNNNDYKECEFSSSEPVYGPSLWIIVHFEGMVDSYSVRFSENGDMLDVNTVDWHSELTIFDLDPLGRVTGSTEYYEIQYDDVPYKGPEGNLFYVEALGINSGSDSDSCSNVIYDLAQEE